MFREEVRKHLSDRFLAKRDLTFSGHCLHPEEHCVNVFFARPSPRLIPIAKKKGGKKREKGKKGFNEQMRKSGKN